MASRTHFSRGCQWMNWSWWSRGSSHKHTTGQSHSSTNASYHDAIFTLKVKALSITSQRYWKTKSGFSDYQPSKVVKLINISCWPSMRSTWQDIGLVCVVLFVFVLRFIKMQYENKANIQLSWQNKLGQNRIFYVGYALGLENAHNP